jgi:hypothetical protein
VSLCYCKILWTWCSTVSMFMI